MKSTEKADRFIKELKYIIDSINPLLFNSGFEDHEKLEPLRLGFSNIHAQGEQIDAEEIKSRINNYFRSDLNSGKDLDCSGMFFNNYTTKMRIAELVYAVNKMACISNPEKLTLFDPTGMSSLGVTYLGLNSIHTPSFEDVKAELIEICPDIKDLPHYLKMYKVKFQKVLDTIPEVNKSLETEPNKFQDKLDGLVEIGFTSEDDKIYYLMYISHLLFGLKRISNKFKEYFDEMDLMKSVESDNTKNPGNPFGHKWDTDDLKKIAKVMTDKGRINDGEKFVDIMSGKVFSKPINWLRPEEDLKTFLLFFSKQVTIEILPVVTKGKTSYSTNKNEAAKLSNKEINKYFKARGNDIKYPGHKFTTVCDYEELFQSLK